MVVKNVLEQQQLHPQTINLGEVDIEEQELTADKLSEINSALTELGFELIDDRKSRIIEKIKNAVVELVHYNNDETKLKHSEYIAAQLHYDYTYLSKLFSEVEGMTIEQYIIYQKIEKVKELLVYDELSLSEIAYQLGYSSVAHLSAQFKKVTGFTPSFFKKNGISHRKPIDKVGNKTM
jgi:AraC-like DNA-binding protein